MQDEGILKKEIRFKLSDLIGGTLQFNYERLLNEHISVELGAGYKGVNSLVRLSGIDTDGIQPCDIPTPALKLFQKFAITSTKRENMVWMVFILGPI